MTDLKRAPTAIADPARESPRGRTWVLIRPVAKAERRSIAALAGWSLVEAAPILLSGQLLARAVDRGFLSGDLVTGLGLLVFYGMVMLLGAFGSRQVLGPLASVVESVRDHIVHQVVTASLRAAAVTNTPQDTRVVNRATRQAESVRQISGAMLIVVRSVVFTIASALIGMLTLLPQLAWFTLASLLLSGVLLSLLSRRLRRRCEAELIAEEAATASAARVISALRDIRAGGAEERASAEVGRMIDEHAERAMDTARLGAGRVGIVAVGARVPLAITLLMAPGLVRSGAATPGEIIGAGMYFVQGLEPALRQIVQSLGNTGLRLGVVLRHLTRYTVAAAQPGPDPRGEQGGSRDADGGGFAVELRGVTFAYGPYSCPIVRDFDLRVPEGGHLAVVGPSGIGKSTVVNLIAGLETAQRGTVLLGGTPLSALGQARLRHEVALIPQEDYVFAGTLRENLRYLAPEADDALLEDALDRLRLRAAAEKVGGLDADLTGSHGRLSQGERQLITLARAYVSSARIVLLDEATCHLDPTSEARVEAAFAERPGTLIVVAHRISSALRADQVLVLDGNTARLGEHRTLLRESETYADLAGAWQEAHG
ncbi:ABC transporter ATP-binding protein [Streptomyces sp. NPDC055189]